MNDIKKRLSEKIEKLRDKKLFLYGAKHFGDFASYLFRYYNIPIQGYVLTFPSSNRTLNNLPVYGIDELPFVADKDAIILLTLREKYHMEVKASLHERGFFNIDDAFSSFDFYTVLFSEVCRDIFYKNNINLENDVLEIGQYKQLNPYKYIAMDSFFLEAPDLILPPLFNDFNYIVEGAYEYDSVLLNDGDVVFDCGANIGLFSYYASSKGCRSYAFEPCVHGGGGNLKTILEKNSVLYPSLITHIPYALADKCGYAPLHLSQHNQGATLIDSADDFTETVTTKIITIDQFVEENNIQVDFIKADIEGAERLMLAGAKKTLKRFSPKLAICTYHFDDDPQILEELILDANPNYSIIHKWKKLFAIVK